MASSSSLSLFCSIDLSSCLSWSPSPGDMIPEASCLNSPVSSVASALRSTYAWASSFATPSVGASWTSASSRLISSSMLSSPVTSASGWFSVIYWIICSPLRMFAVIDFSSWRSLTSAPRGDTKEFISSSACPAPASVPAAAANGITDAAISIMSMSAMIFVFVIFIASKFIASKGY